MRRRPRSALALLAALAAALLLPAGARALDPVTGTRDALAISVGWNATESVPGAPVDMTANALAALMEGHVNPWFETVSRHAFHGWATDGAGPYTIRNPGSCAANDDFEEVVSARAKAVAEAEGYDVDDYDQVVVYFSQFDCAWQGRAPSTPGRWATLHGRSGLEVNLVHELGHTLGLDHSDLLKCRDASGATVPLSASCTLQTYGDRYSAMGGGRGSFAANQQHALGWLQGRMQNVVVGDDPVTVLLAPLESDGFGVQALRVLDGDAAYWLEYRAPMGVDVPDASGLPTLGVAIRREIAGELTRSALVDLSAPLEVRAALQPGRSWTNPLGTLRYTFAQVGGFGAELTIESKHPRVPDVLGLERAPASTALSRAGFAAGTVRYAVDGTCGALGAVMEQVPGAGTRAPAGSRVNLTLGTRPSGGCH